MGIPNITIWYRREKESKYHIITQWINRNNQDSIISWNRDINDKFFQFTLKLYNPLDSDSIPFIPNTGDEFVITDHQNNIFGNIFIGIAEDVKRTYYGLDETGEATNKYYDILIQNKDFSTEKGITERLNSSYFNDLLPIVLNNTPSLGGVLSNGINIPKHDYGGENFLIAPLKLIGSQYERLLKLLDLIGWSFIYYYYSELSETNGLHIVKQLNMFPKNSGRSPSWDWQKGITFPIVKNGFLENRDYPDYDDRETIICEKNMTYKKSNRQLKNSIELKLNIKSSLNGNGKKFRKEVIENTNTFNIGGSIDVKSVAIEVITFISSVTSDSIFTIPAEKANIIDYYQERMNNNSLDGLMQCDIHLTGVDYTRNFTLNVSTNTITLTEPISGLTNGLKFTLTGAFDLLPPNLNSYPADGNGYVIKTIDAENTILKFTEYDTPNQEHFITGYYYPVETGYKTKNDVDSINKIGFRGLEEEIKDPVTDEQAEELFAEKRKTMKALEVLNLIATHRKNILDLYSSIDVDFEDIKGRLIVTASEGKVIHDEGFYNNTPLIIQDIELSSYKDNYGDLLAKIQNNSKATMNLNLKNNVEEIIRASIFIREKANDSQLNLIIPEITGVSGITTDEFTLEFLSSNTSGYLVDISDNIDFTTFIKQNSLIYVVSAPNNPVSFNFTITGHSYPLYVRIRAFRGAEISSFSNTQQVNSGINRTGLKVELNLKNSSLVDTSSYGNDLVLVNGATFTSDPVLSGDTTSVYFDGINDYAYVNHDTSFDGVIFTFEIAFEIHDSVLSYMPLITRYDDPTGIYNIQFFASIQSDKIIVSLYDQSVAPTNDTTRHYFTEFASTSAQGFTIDTPYVIQFSWNDTTKAYCMTLNRINVPISENSTVNAGLISSNSLNNKYTASTKLVLGAYIYSGGVDASNANLRIARLRYWTKSHSLNELQSLYDDLITT